MTPNDAYKRIGPPEKRDSPWFAQNIWGFEPKSPQTCHPLRQSTDASVIIFLSIAIVCCIHRLSFRRIIDFKYEILYLSGPLSGLFGCQGRRWRGKRIRQATETFETCDQSPGTNEIHPQAKWRSDAHLWVEIWAWLHEFQIRAWMEISLTYSHRCICRNV